MGVLAWNRENNKLEMCNASPENRGKGRCKHDLHQNPNETAQEFLDRISQTGGIKPYVPALENSAYMREYNKEAAKQIISLFESGEEGACVVQATSTGKSAITCAVLNHYADYDCIYVSPYDNIEKQMVEYNNGNPIALLGNLHTIQYQNIASAYRRGEFEKKFGKLKDKGKIIVLDESHHVQSNKWGEAIKAFHKFVSGDDCCTLLLSATPKGEDANGFDPISEYAGGNIINDLPLEECIKRGIIEMPEVHTDLNESQANDIAFKIFNEISKADLTPKQKLEWQSKVMEAMKKPKFRPRSDLIKWTVMEEAKRCQKDGKGSKIIVFCSDIADADAKLKEYQAIFEGNEQLKFDGFQYHSNSSAAEAMKFFNFNDHNRQVPEGHVEAVFVVGMYNEGVHAPDVNLEIHDAPIKGSRTLYLQRVGRVCSSKRPKILDLAGNSEQGYVDWHGLAAEVGKEDMVTMGPGMRVASDLAKIRTEFLMQTYPMHYGMSDTGECVKILDVLHDLGFKGGQGQVRDVAEYLKRHPNDTVEKACRSLAWLERKNRR